VGLKVTLKVDPAHRKTTSAKMIRKNKIVSMERVLMMMMRRRRRRML
jgi:hypothetical protein